MAKKEILNNDTLTVRVNAEPVIDAVGNVVDVIENLGDNVETSAAKIVTVTKNNPFLIAGALLVGISIGGFVAYKVTKKRLSEEFEDELTEQIAAAKSYHRRMAKEGEFESPESAVQALVPDEIVEAVNSYKGREKRVPYNKPETLQDPRSPVDVVVEEVNVQQNVFVEAKTSSANSYHWDYNAEIADRELNPEQPYVISFEEFHENPEGNEQSTLAYYINDDTLTDEKDQPIDNTEYVVGDDNLLRFGHGSKDSNVVYVRNERLGMDYEIIRSNGSYKRDVLGLSEGVSIRHSQRRPNRRQWSADE